MDSDPLDQPPAREAPLPIEELQNRLGYTFSDETLLHQALTHRSTPQEPSQENQGEGEGIWHNERLEFLGDAVLDLVVSSLLYHHYPNAAEGDLSHWRSALVNTRSLSILAEEICLGPCLVMGRGEDLSGGREKVSILGNCFEAILGALFLDGGLAVAQNILTNLLSSQVKQLQEVNQHKDYKSLLQEKLQSVGRSLPTYRVTSVEGPPHERLFEVSCLLEDDKVMGVGSGNTKRHAEQSAAKEVFESVNKTIIRGKSP
jgi:ribonuclease III